MDNAQSLIQKMIDFGALGYQRGLILGAGGNLSCRWDMGLWITASGVCLRAMAPADILLVDGAGCIVQGQEGRRPSIETPFHRAIYQARPDVNCVYHTHATYCTYWALRERELPLVTSVARMLLGPVPLVDYAEPGSPQLVENIRQALSQSSEAKGLLLAGHGAVALGPSVEDAFYTAELMEQTAQLAYMLERA